MQYTLLLIGGPADGQLREIEDRFFEGDRYKIDVYPDIDPNIVASYPLPAETEINITTFDYELIQPFFDRKFLVGVPEARNNRTREDKFKYMFDSLVEVYVEAKKDTGD